jgi:hypothetical protein
MSYLDNTFDPSMQQLAELLDFALSSDNIVVRDQLQKLLLVTALVSSPEPTEKCRGLFSAMLDDINILIDRVNNLEHALEKLKGRNVVDFTENFEKWANEKEFPMPTFSTYIPQHVSSDPDNYKFIINLKDIT